MGQIKHQSSNGGADEGEDEQEKVEILLKTIGPLRPSRLKLPSCLKVCNLRKLVAENGHLPTETLSLILRGNVLNDKKDGEDIYVQFKDGDSLMVSAKPKTIRRRIPVGDDDDDEEEEDELKFQLPETASRWKWKLYRFLHEKMKLPDIVLMAIFSLSVKAWVVIFLWFIMAPIAYDWDLGPLYILGTGFLIIFLNLGQRQAGDVSAYSIFNEDFRELPGTLNAERLDRDIRTERICAVEEMEGSTDFNNAKRPSRRQVLEKKKTIDEQLKAASSLQDPLAPFPTYLRYDAKACLQSGRGDKLSTPTKQCMQNLLKLNMEGHYGSEWPSEEKVKRKEMVASEARYIFVYELSDGRNVDTHSLSDPSEHKGVFAGFVHYRFILEEELPVLYVYELQLVPHSHGKGLGKFLMQLLEMIACKNSMAAIMLTVQKANLSALSFYISKLRYAISSTSPSRVDPLLGTMKNYEILVKAFTDEAKSKLECALSLKQ
ncbi:hypothetical protein V2J09_014821 [Rumex salicifolius]